MVSCTDVVKVDVSKALQPEQHIGVLAQYDRKAHVFGAELVNGSKAVDLTDCTVLGYFTSPNGTTWTITGSAEGNTASVRLTDRCYVLSGRFKLTIKVRSKDGYMRTVRMVTGNVVECMDANYWQTAQLSVEQTGANEVTCTVKPNIECDSYVVAEVHGANYTPVCILGGDDIKPDGTATGTAYATEGEHYYTVRPMLNGVKNDSTWPNGMAYCIVTQWEE